MIKLEKQSNHQYFVFFENGVKIGEFLQEVDGFFVFYSEENGGYWESHILRILSDELDKLNKPWKEEMDKFFLCSS